ncbi:signal peptidase II [Novosphingobium olei]|uniref:Lipoprotein signal peptidase n=1 Tax=Novosphingobium olei TaxID=2728851 RepID=A0A7Y0BPZ1_9SPHN|nr:signal peptidase II [Novosphingobium olei]NML94455.1 signal peptidase II [Novosphingobium olei]
MTRGALRALGLGAAFAVFVLDQLVKWIVVGPLDLINLGSIHLLPFFDLRFTRNYGVSLGMFTASSAEMRFGLVAVTALIASGVLVWLWLERARWDVFGLGLVLGGALGNIRDRLTVGFVIDYADFHIGEWRPFLIFNLADVAITIGVLILLARSLLSREKPASGNPVPTETN